MDTKQIEILLEKYFNGQTTLQEERELGDYFLAGSVDPDLLPFREQFVLIRALQEQEPPGPDFEDRLAGLIDAQDEKILPGRRFSFGFRWVVAATIAILLGVGSYLALEKQSGHQRDTYSDTNLAYAEVQKTLRYVSYKMNRGIKPLSTVSKINAGAESLKKLEKLDTGMEMLNMVSIINNSSNLKK